MSDGKYCEGKVKKILEEESQRIAFSFERLYDARSARGMFPAQTSDFFVVCVGPDAHSRAIYIECKETESPDQINVSDFPQFPKMKRKILAGACGLLVVYHTKLKKYRITNLKDFPLSTTVFKLKGYEFEPLKNLPMRCYTCL